MSSEVIAATISGVLAIIGTLLVTAFPLWWNQRQNKDVQVFKLCYIKVMHLAPLDGPPVYTAHLSRPTPAGTSVPVYDEVRAFRLNKLATTRSGFRSRDRSSGIVDLLVLYPYNERLLFPDKAAERIMGHIDQVVRQATDTVLSMSTYYNGLNKDNEDWAIMMEHRTLEARLILDLSSIPEHHRIMKGLPRGTVTRGDQELGRSLTEPRPGVYSLDASGLEAGDVLRIDLSLDRTSTRLRQG